MIIITITVFKNNVWQITNFVVPIWSAKTSYVSVLKYKPNCFFHSYNFTTSQSLISHCTFIIIFPDRFQGDNRLTNMLRGILPYTDLLTSFNSSWFCWSTYNKCQIIRTLIGLPLSWIMTSSLALFDKCDKFRLFPENNQLENRRIKTWHKFIKYSVKMDFFCSVFLFYLIRDGV